MLAFDIRYAWRVLRRNPGFTGAVVLTLGLGIGANLALFGVADALLLKTLPVPQPEQLTLLTTRTERGETNLEMSYPLFTELQARTSAVRLFAGTSGEDRMQARVASTRDLEDLTVALVSGNFFDVLGVGAVRGRVLIAADDASPGALVAVLNHRYWQRRFGGQDSAVGQQLQIQNVPFTIAGVAPKGFAGHVVGESPDVWVPVGAQPQLWNGLDYTRMSNVDWIRVGGRLDGGASLAQAQADVSVTLGAIVRDWASTPQAAGVPRSPQVVLTDGRRGFSTLRPRFERPLKVLGAAVGLLLLVTCVNVASLVSARVAGRRHEIAIRLAVGARRRDVVRQGLVESLLLASLGGLAGLLVAVWTTDAMLPLLGTRGAPSALTTRVDLRLLTVAAALVAGTGLALGMLPALTSLRPPSLAAVTARFRPTPLGRVLVMAQVAMSLVLLTGAVLFVRTLGNLRSLDAGFDRSPILMAEVNPMAAGFQPPALASVNARVRAALAAIPGVDSVSQSGLGLMSGRSSVCCITVPGYQPAPGERMSIRTNDVSPDYFATLGMRIVAGRRFTAADAAPQSRVVIVNEAFGRRYFGDPAAVGRSFAFGTSPSGDRHIVGVVADARYDGLRLPSQPMVFHPARDAAFLQSIELRTTGDPAAFAATVRRTLAEVEPRLPVRAIFTVEQLLDASLAQERLMARLAVFFAALAALLACVGTYALLSQSVTARTRDIATRIALGARPGQVRALVWREGAGLVIVGLAVGAAAAAMTTRVASSLLFGVTPRDPLALLAASAAMAAVTLAAAIVPIRRAARIVPVVALRQD